MQRFFIIKRDGLFRVFDAKTADLALTITGKTFVGTKSYGLARHVASHLEYKYPWTS